MTSDRFDELIALATLGELTAAEQRELDTAASSDPDAGEELGEALATAAALQQLHAEEPPARLRDSVLATIASTVQDDTSSTRDHHERSYESSPEAIIPEPSTVASFEAHRSRRRLRPMLLTAAAVALFAVGGVLVITTNNTSTSDPIAAVLEAPDATSRPLTGQIAGVTVVYSASEDALVVTGEGLAVLDDSATYQLWLISNDTTTSVGVFRPDPNGIVAARFADADPTGFVLAVTEEPAGGSPTPSLPILASA